MQEGVTHLSLLSYEGKGRETPKRPVQPDALGLELNEERDKRDSCLNHDRKYAL